MDPKEAPEKAGDSLSPPPEQPQPVLSPEQQMEQFEESLKESDWGHQPC
jgi:hypothetical protein